MTSFGATNVIRKILIVKIYRLWSFGEQNTKIGLKKNDKCKLELLFDLVIVTVSQFNTKLAALELIGNRDFFPQSMPVPNGSKQKEFNQVI